MQSTPLYPALRCFPWWSNTLTKYFLLKQLILVENRTNGSFSPESSSGNCRCCEEATCQDYLLKSRHADASWTLTTMNDNDHDNEWQRSLICWSQDMWMPHERSRQWMKKMLISYFWTSLKRQRVKIICWSQDMWMPHERSRQWYIYIYIYIADLLFFCNMIIMVKNGFNLKKSPLFFQLYCGGPGFYPCFFISGHASQGMLWAVRWGALQTRQRASVA